MRQRPAHEARQTISMPCSCVVPICKSIGRWCRRYFGISRREDRRSHLRFDQRLEQPLCWRQRVTRRSSRISLSWESRPLTHACAHRGAAGHVRFFAARNSLAGAWARVRDRPSAEDCRTRGHRRRKSNRTTTGRWSVRLSAQMRGGGSRPYSPGRRESRPSSFASPCLGEPSP